MTEPIASTQAKAAWATIDHERTEYAPVIEFAKLLGVTLPANEVVCRWWDARTERIARMKGGAVWLPRDPEDVFVGIFEAKLKEPHD